LNILWSLGAEVVAEMQVAELAVVAVAAAVYLPGKHQWYQELNYGLLLALVADLLVQEMAVTEGIQF
jgi:hypothetical protein